MMRSEVIEGLEFCVANPNPNDNGWSTQVSMNIVLDAIDLLKAQEPVEPYGQYSVHTGTKYIVCGACEKPLCMMKDSYRPKYCPECGRMVKWHANEAEK